MPSFMPYWPKNFGAKSLRHMSHRSDAFKDLLEKIGNPQLNLSPVIHVAGTNGKGSTIAFLRRILECSGYKVNVYTSPHLRYFNERIVVGGEQISDSQLRAVLEECRIHVSEHELSFFEITTCAAFLAFAGSKSDFTLVETGIGGRIDATNCIQDALINVITSISKDHTEYLGDTIEDIAFEKAGIIKGNNDRVAIVSKQNYIEANKVIEHRAITERVPVYRFGYEWSCNLNNNGSMFFQSSGEEVEFPSPSLLGEHQIYNAGNAIAAATILSKKYGYVSIDHDVISNALKSTYWPARLELVTSNFDVPNNFQIFLDGAHNVDAARTLSKWMLGKHVYLIIGITIGRNPEEFISELAPNAQSLFGVCVQSEPNSYVGERIKLAGENCGLQSYAVDTVGQAIKMIAENNSEYDGELIILICGSLYLAGDVKSNC